MDDLISRQAAVSICDNAIDLWNGQLGAGALIAVRDAIEALPSADIDLSGFSDKLWAAAYERGKADAVRHGHWIDKDGGIATCSECGERWGVWSVMNYCPHCGALMNEVT